MLKSQEGEEGSDMNRQVVLKGKEVENERMNKEIWKKYNHDHTEFLLVILLLTSHFGDCSSFTKPSQPSRKLSSSLCANLSAMSPKTIVRSRACRFHEVLEAL